MARRARWAATGAGVLVALVLSGVSFAEEHSVADGPPGPRSAERAAATAGRPSSDCETRETPADQSDCAAQALAGHERAFQACRAALPPFLRDQLDAEEQAWKRDLELECAPSDARCLSAACRQRNDAMRAAFPTCGASGEPPETPDVNGRERTGMLPARWTPPHGTPQEVPFSYEAERASTGKMSTTLGRGGEQFHGSYVRIEKSTQGHLVTAIYDGWSRPEWETWTHDSDGHWTVTGISFDEFARFYTGKVVASLRGSAGNSMRCQLTLRRPDSGLLGGGSGACQISDGGRLALEF